MADYVLTEWYASNTPRPNDGAFVCIKGRASGIISFILTLMKVSPRVQLSVTIERVHFEVGSISGFEKRIIPLSKVSSSYFGYIKPWKEAIFLSIFLMWILGGIGSTATNSILVGFLGALFGLIVGVLYYVLNKKMMIAVIEDAGIASGFQFKRSVIEGASISEAEAASVCEIVQKLVDERTRLQAVQ